jgi:hypothetical protein
MKEFPRFGDVVQAAGSPDMALMLGHELTGLRDLGVKRAQLKHTHHIAVIARAAHRTDRAGGWGQIDLPARSRLMLGERHAVS